ncbi:hypothetical protein [Xanthomonas sacchari]|uniref:hypothetical protein n=1 Tax=Xanthomonas sacchari TaxID=56458 RepID=UPI0035276FB6
MTMQLRPLGGGTEEFERWRLFAPLVLFLVGFWLVPLPHTCWLQCVPGDLGDARFNGIILEYFYRWLGGHEQSLISPGFFYPMPGALTFSDNHWGSAWIYSLFRAVGADQYRAFDLWYLTAYALNYLAAHLFLRRMRFSPVASALGAFVFAFAMPVAAKYTHAQLMYRCMLPVALLAWQKFREGGRPLWVGGAALAVAVQFYMSIYLGYMTVLLLGSWIVSQALFDRRWPWQAAPGAGTAAFPLQRDLVLSAGLCLAALAAVAWLMYPYIHFSKLYHFKRDSSEIASMLPHWSSYLLADGSSLWGGISSKLAPGLLMRQEHQLFIGLGAILLALTGLLLSKSRLCVVAALSLAALMLLTLQVREHSLYLLLSHVPGINSIRAVTRIILALLLPIALLVAAGVDALRQRGGVGVVVLSLLGMLLLIEPSTVHTTHYSPGDAQARIERLIRLLPAQMPPTAPLYVPGNANEPFYLTELDGMALAQSLGRVTLNGYSGNFPAGYGPLTTVSPCTQAADRLRAAAQFYAERLRQPLPEAASDTVLVIGHASCRAPSLHLPSLEEMRSLSLQIIEVRRVQAAGWEVTVRLNNGMEQALPGMRSPHPARLSWQLHVPGSVADPGGWVPRIEIGEDDLQPGQSRDFKFQVPAVSGPRLLSVSAVVEGHAWLHDAGRTPVQYQLD